MNNSDNDEQRRIFPAYLTVIIFCLTFYLMRRKLCCVVFLFYFQRLSLLAPELSCTKYHHEGVGTGSWVNDNFPNFLGRWRSASHILSIWRRGLSPRRIQ